LSYFAPLPEITLLWFTDTSHVIVALLLSSWNTRKFQQNHIQQHINSIFNEIRPTTLNSSMPQLNASETATSQDFKPEVLILHAYT
jgi:hypothetical protein